MWRAPALIVAMILALASACGEEQTDPTVTSVDDAAPFTMTAEGEIEVSCGGDSGWAPSVMATGLPEVLTDSEARSIFEGILSDPELGVEAELSLFRNGADVDWRVLRDDGDALLLGLGSCAADGPTGRGDYYLGLEREGGDWRPSGWGDCTLSPVLKAGNAWAQLTGFRGDPASTRSPWTFTNGTARAAETPSRSYMSPTWLRPTSR